MRLGRQEARCSGDVASASATVTSSHVVRTAPRGKALGIMAALAALVTLIAAQAAQVNRRYGGASPDVRRIDVTVAPFGVAQAGQAALEMAAFGDSSVAGVGVYALEEPLPVQLAQRVADGSGRHVHVVGYARSGARTRDVLAGQVPSMRHAPDVSVVVVGTNDVTHLTSLLPLARSSAELFSALADQRAPVVVSSLPEFRAMRLLPNPLSAAVRSYSGLVRIVQRCAASRSQSVYLVDVRRAVGREFIDDVSNMSPDLFHPSASGYGRIADAMAPTVLAALQTRKSQSVSA